MRTDNPHIVYSSVGSGFRVHLAAAMTSAVVSRLTETAHGFVSRMAAIPRTWRSVGGFASGVAGCFLDELHTRGQTEFGVDVGEVGLHGAGRDEKPCADVFVAQVLH